MIDFVLLLILLVLIFESVKCRSNFTRGMTCSLSLFPSGLHIKWENYTQKEEYIDKGRYIVRNILVTRFQMCEDKVFVITPRFRKGIPFSVGTVDVNDYCRAEPLLGPFPNWEMHSFENLNAIQNAIDAVVDYNNILWILDCGIVNTLASPQIVNQPRIFGISAKTGKLHQLINLSSLVSETSRLQFIEAEVTEDGFTFIYISDAGCNSIIVWDIDNCQGYNYNLPKEMRTSDKDVLYMLIAKGGSNGTKLYFTYLNGRYMYHIQTSRLRSGGSHKDIVCDGEKPGKFVILGTDNGQTIFFRLKEDQEVLLWNSNKPFDEDNILIAHKTEDGRFSTQVAPGYRKLVWHLASNFQDYLLNSQGSIGVSTKLAPLIRHCEQ